MGNWTTEQTSELEILLRVGNGQSKFEEWKTPIDKPITNLHNRGLISIITHDRKYGNTIEADPDDKYSIYKLDITAKGAMAIEKLSEYYQQI